jgi:peptidoglycan/LPS O-acetylase OafA/YrhL
MQPAPPTAGASRIPSLDGIRGLAMIFVIITHLEGTQGFPLSRKVLRFFELGPLGLRSFFVMSGFLITSILLKELRRDGRISLPRFYIRRSLRIFPAYYIYLAFLLVANGWLVALKPGDMLHAATYTDNYNTCCHSGFVGHLWSLGVEEQFYLLWPALLILAGLNRSFWVVAAFVLAAPIVRVGLWYLVPEIRHGIPHRFETVADSIAIGCLLARYRDQLWSWEPWRRLLTSRWMVLVPILLLIVGSQDRPRAQYALGYTFTNICMVACIDWVMRFPQSHVGRFLNWKPIVVVGVLSYSLYIWQGPFTNRYSDHWVSGFPQNLVFLAIAATMSHYLIERPGMRLRSVIDRYWSRQDAGRSAAPIPVPAFAPDLVQAGVSEPMRAPTQRSILS